MKRQLDDYYDKFYIKEAKRFAKLTADENRLAKDIALWKETVAERWDAIHVVSKEDQCLAEGSETGVKYTVKYVIDEQGLNDAIGLELIVLKNDQSGDDHELYTAYPFHKTAQDGNLYTFEADFEPDDAGAFKYCVRMYPKNEALPHRQDFCYVKWLD